MSLTNPRLFRSWLKSAGFTATFAAYSSVAVAWQDGLILSDAPPAASTPAVTITSDDAPTTSILEQTVVTPSGQDPIAIEEVEGATPLMQGPIHEAFAERFDLDDEDALVIDRQPPQPIDEQPPEYRPDGDDIEWIPGYWGWDIANDDFIWVSGVWRQVPPGQQWIPGYWTQADNGWRWVSGFWTAIANPQIVYLPAPPASIDNGPSSPAPGPNYFWIPGYWLYGSSGNYVWHAGHWHACHNNWVWIPARYVWTPSGYVYRAGYWDYGVGDRGMLFAPIAFQPGFNRSYRPCYVIETSPLLFANLYVAPGTSYYYFGSCYAHSQRRCYPWVSYYNHGYDPLFSYYAYQSSQRVWLRNVTTLQSQFAAGPQAQQRWTVADQMNFHHHAGNHGINPGLNSGVNPGINPGALNPGINPGVNNPQANGLNAMMHVAPLAALALAANSNKVDFKTPFAVKQANAQNNLASTQQLNELAKKRRDLEKASLTATSSGVASIGNPVGPGGSPSGQPQVLKQIELVKPSKNGSSPIDLKVGAINPRVFSQSIGVQPSANSGNTPSSNTGSVPGSSILSNNKGIGGNVGNNLGGTNTGTSKPNNSGNASGTNGSNSTAGNSGRTKRNNNQAQQFSQLLGGTNSPISNSPTIDPKSLESLRNQALGAVTGNTTPSGSGSVVNNSNAGSSTTANNTPNNVKKAPPLPKNFPNLNNGATGNPLVNQLGGSQNNTNANNPSNAINPGGVNQPGNNSMLGGKNGSGLRSGANGSANNQGSGQSGLGGLGQGGSGLGGNILGGNKPNNPTTTNKPSLPGTPGSIPGTLPGSTGGTSGTGSNAGGKPGTPGAGAGSPSGGAPLGSGNTLGGSSTLGGNRSGGNKTGGTNPGSSGPSTLGGSGSGGSGGSGSGLGSGLGGNRPGNTGTGGGLGGNIGGGGRLGGGGTLGGGGSTSGSLRSGGNQGGKTGTNGSGNSGSGNSGNKNGGKRS